MRTQRETDLEAKIERLQARVEALEGVREAAEKASKFRFGVTFDAKGTYTKRKCVEWTSLYLPLREALAATELGDSDE